MDLGKRNKMTVVREVDFGVYLDGGDMGDVLLPRRYVPRRCRVGDELDVFLYLDQQERLIATTEEPKVEVGQFGYLEVSWVNEFGAFLNWGLMKDLFCPFREQKMRMVQGKSYIVYCYVDSVTYRIVASAKVEKFLSKEHPQYKSGDEVDVLVQQKTELGFKVIVDGQFAGQLYENELFRQIHTGDRMKAFVKHVREDGKIDLVLQKHGQEHVHDFAETLLSYIREHNGVCEYHDKSDAEDIYREFGVSKKVFKKAVGDLYKRGVIKILPDRLEELKG